MSGPKARARAAAVEAMLFPLNNAKRRSPISWLSIEKKYENCSQAATKRSHHKFHLPRV